LKDHVPSGIKHEEADYHAKIDELCDKFESKTIASRQDIHRHPELGNNEVRTAKIIADHLKDCGFDEIKTGVGVHGVVGILKGSLPGDKVFGMRADIDALPVQDLSSYTPKSEVDGVHHACGHGACRSKQTFHSPCFSSVKSLTF
jgi:amidohydrolase